MQLSHKSINGQGWKVEVENIVITEKYSTKKDCVELSGISHLGTEVKFLDKGSGIYVFWCHLRNYWHTFCNHKQISFKGLHYVKNKDGKFYDKKGDINPFCQRSGHIMKMVLLQLTQY